MYNEDCSFLLLYLYLSFNPLMDLSVNEWFNGNTRKQSNRYNSTGLHKTCSFSVVIFHELL